MPDIAQTQDNFLGGEWSLYAQGRWKHPKYSTAMSVCRNGLPLEEGAWTRRSGTWHMGTTRSGADGRLINFDFTEPTPYKIELTNDHIRLWAATGLVYTNDPIVLLGVSDANPAQFLATTSTFAVDDQVQFAFSGTRPDNAALLANRTFKISAIDGTGTLYTLVDAITGAAVDGSQVNFSPSPGTIKMFRVLDITSPYTSTDWSQDMTRSVQSGVDPDGTVSGTTFLLRNDVAPQVLNCTSPQPNAPQFATFSLSPADLLDGPYLDAPNGLYVTPSGTTGNITCTFEYQAFSATVNYNLGDIVVSAATRYQSLQDGNINHLPPSSQWKAITTLPGINNGAGFVAGDVGRAIRLFSEPPAWNNATAYIVGNNVQYPFGSGQYWNAVGANTNVTPGSDLTKWLPAANAAQWAWGRITTVNSANSIVISLIGFGPETITPGAVSTLLYNSTVYSFRLGVYSDNTGWPGVGVYHEGRVWFAGAVSNRFDTSCVNAAQGIQLNMAPTAYDGTVGDANGISEILNSDTLNQINWMKSTTSGVVIGTLQGEWLITASNISEAITPSNAQAKQVSRYGTAAVEPVNAPIATIFVQKLKRKVLEYLQDVYTGRYRAPNISVFAKHLTEAGLAELRYQEEIAPILWARMQDGTLAGCTYRRISQFVYGEQDLAAEAAIVGWHRHDHGAGRTWQSIMVGPNAGGTLDTLSAVTNQPAASAPDHNVRHVETLVDLFQEGDAITSAWYLDDAIVPSSMAVSSTGVTLYGLWDLNGQTVTAWIGGLDCGDFLVTNGSIVVPFGSAGPAPAQSGLFTLAYLQGLNSNAYGNVASQLSDVTITVPVPNTAPAIEQWQVDNLGDHQAIKNSWIQPDFDNNRAFFIENDGSLVSISTVTGAVLQHATPVEMGFTGGHAPTLGTGDGCLGPDGYIYFSTNVNSIAKINPNTLTLVSESTDILLTGGIIGLSPTTDPTTGITMLAVSYDGLTGTGGVQWFNTQTMALIGSLYQDAGKPNGFATGTGHVTPGMAFGVYTYSSQPEYGATMGIYRATVSNGVPTIGKVFTLAATSVNPIWNNIGPQSVPLIDDTDGNLLLLVSPYNLAGAMIKINALTGAVMWTVPIPSGNTAMGQGTWNHSRITGGVLGFMVASDIVAIDTLTGASTTVSLGSGNGQLGGGQVTDSVTGINISISQFTSSTNAINAKPTYGTPTGFSFQWAVLKPGTFFQGFTAAQTNYTIPAIVGRCFTSQGQLLRAVNPNEAGSAAGPALGKTRRSHMYSALLVNSQGASFSGSLTSNTLYPANYKINGGSGAALAPNVLYSDVMWDVLNSSYSFNDTLGWQVTRPYPTTIAAVSTFRHTQDR